MSNGLMRLGADEEGPITHPFPTAYDLPIDPEDLRKLEAYGEWNRGLIGRSLLNVSKNLLEEGKDVFGVDQLLRASIRASLEVLKAPDRHPYEEGVARKALADALTFIRTHKEALKKSRLFPGGLFGMGSFSGRIATGAAFPPFRGPYWPPEGTKATLFDRAGQFWNTCGVSMKLRLIREARSRFRSDIRPEVSSLWNSLGAREKLHLAAAFSGRSPENIETTLKGLGFLGIEPTFKERLATIKAMLTANREFFDSHPALAMKTAERAKKMAHELRNDIMAKEGTVDPYTLYDLLAQTNFQVKHATFQYRIAESVVQAHRGPVGALDGMGMAEMLQKCMICGKVYGRISVPDDDPAAGKVSHGFCPDCANDPKVQKEYFGH